MAERGSWTRSTPDAAAMGAAAATTMSNSSDVTATATAPVAGQYEPSVRIEKDEKETMRDQIEEKAERVGAHATKYNALLGEPKQASDFAHHPRHSNGDTSSGPAAPLKPLYISSSSSFEARPLPHPAAYAGPDSNWAFTPSDTIPSLPSTPSRWSSQQTSGLAAASGQRLSTPTGSDSGSAANVQTSSSSRNAANIASGANAPLQTARAVFQRRMDEQRNYSPSPARNQRPSPKIGYASLASGMSVNTGSPVVSPTSNSIRNMSISEGLSGSLAPAGTANPQAAPASIASVLSPTNGLGGGIESPSPSLRHRDSLSSLASSTLGQHALAHSRRASQALLQSPSTQLSASSNHAGPANFRPAPGYRVYRPPHLRTESYYDLQPRMAHYDRVSAPSMRGQTRSPSLSVQQTASSSASRTPSERGSMSPGPIKRKLSSVGAQNVLLQHANSGSIGTAATSSASSQFDSNSLIAKLANAKLDLRPTYSESSPRGSDHFSVMQREGDEEDDDVELTAEDMMMMSGTLTDQYCRSRSASVSVSESDSSPHVDILEVGDRLGPGTMHDGHAMTIAETSEGFSDQSADWSGSQLEVVSKLGEGSYALVYLVKEVPRSKRTTNDASESDVFGPSTLTPSYDRSATADEADETIHQNADIYSSTIKASASGRLTEEDPTKAKEASSLKADDTKYFALKCLCKRDLSDDMLEVQRLEATIHQSIPPHENIVTLHRTYETSEWLFLVLEYCPGQDLFYWLEQAHDSENLGAATPCGDSTDSLPDLTSTDSTPPSPSLLASTESRFLLSRRRLRLISRMFQQMCEAVQFCHSRGISHRDIKPENFIVEDTRDSSSADKSSMAVDVQGGDSSGSEGVKVKLTDFGLAVAQTQCIDFDCGSKPYMSYECRNNITQWYNPIESDIWSLGIVLLNLIFHRNPFSEPNVERCASFASYVQEPVLFLTTAFRGLKREAAHFLAENVFCDVTEGDESTRRRRISARQFGEWASSLADHLYVRGTEMPPFPSTLSPLNTSLGPDFGITSPLWHSRSPASSNVNSLLASPASNARSINIHQELTSMGITEEEIQDFTPLFNDTLTVPTADSVLTATVASTASQKTEDSVARQSDQASQETTNEEFNLQEDSIKVPSGEAATQGVGDFSDIHVVPNGEAETAESGDVDEGGDDAAAEHHQDEDADSLLPPPSATSTSAQSKRRKRGARRGRTLAKQELKRSRSVENLQTEESKVASSTSSTSSKDAERDRMIRELAQASQSLAREMSKAMYQQNGTAKGSTDAEPNATVDNLPSPVVASTYLGKQPALTPSAARLSRQQHPSSTAADWRDRNASQASLASVSSISSVSTFMSDVGSVRSTASAPPALARNRGRGQLSSLAGTSSFTSTSSSSNRQSALAALRSNAGSNATGKLGTINERGGTPSRASQKDLDASYLAEIFGGSGGSRSSRRTPQQPGNHASRAPPRNSAIPAQQSRQHAPSAIPKNGSKAAPAADKAQSSVTEARESSAIMTKTPNNASDPAANAIVSHIGQKASEQSHITVTPASDDAANASEQQDTASAHSASLGQRKKMLGKFLQGVKSYNKGVKAAPAYDMSK